MFHFFSSCFYQKYKVIYCNCFFFLRINSSLNLQLIDWFYNLNDRHLQKITNKNNINKHWNNFRYKIFLHEQQMTYVLVKIENNQVKDYKLFVFIVTLLIAQNRSSTFLFPFWIWNIHENYFESSNVQKISIRFLL